MYRAQLTALDTLQHRLARDAQSFHRRPHGEPSAWRLLQEAGPQLVSQPDLPRSAGCELLAADEAILKPAVQRGWSHTQLPCGFGHRDQLSIWWVGRRLVTQNVPVLTQAGDCDRGESLPACGPPTLAIENAGDQCIWIMDGEPAQQCQRLLVGAERPIGGVW